MLCNICQYTIHAEVRFGNKGLAAERTFDRAGAAPVFAQTYFAEAVTARRWDRIAEDVLAQRAHKVLLRQEAKGWSHFLEKYLQYLKQVRWTLGNVPSVYSFWKRSVKPADSQHKKKTNKQFRTLSSWQLKKMYRATVLHKRCPLREQTVIECDVKGNQ